METTNPEHIQATIEASTKAYAPYSHFHVGALLVGENGQTFSGCNVENASYGLTNCAERTAIFKAVSEGITDFKTLYIYGETEAPISPCGACRQVISEFCPSDLPVHLLSKNGEQVKTMTVGELIPYSFQDLT
ncbi:MAG: cytidine deaminase [Streptococcaceae bacterium]|nr:cytidine deaminase [Streptococcaceae bacterium]